MGVFSCSLFEFGNKSTTLKVTNGGVKRAMSAATWEVGQLSVSTAGKAGRAGRALGAPVGRGARVAAFLASAHRRRSPAPCKRFFHKSVFGAQCAPGTVPGLGETQEAGRAPHVPVER